MILKTVILSVFFLFISHIPLEAKTIYQWNDASGVIHISDQRPPREANARVVAVGGDGGTGREGGPGGMGGQTGEKVERKLTEVPEERARKREGDIRKAQGDYERAKAQKEQLERSYRRSRNAIRKVYIKKQVIEAKGEMEKQGNILQRLESKTE